MSQGNLTFAEFKSSLPTVALRDISHDERIEELKSWTYGSEPEERLSPGLRHEVAMSDRHYQTFLDHHGHENRVRIKRGFMGKIGMKVVK